MPSPPPELLPRETLAIPIWWNSSRFVDQVACACHFDLSFIVYCSNALHQDPEPSPNAPSFLLKLANDDELHFTFTFVIRQESNGTVSDANINGLTYVYASTGREVENLVTREFHADPNLHKNANVDLVGDFTTGGSSSVSFDWTWKWKPPKAIEDRGGGWRSVCSVSYKKQSQGTSNT